MNFFNKIYRIIIIFYLLCKGAKIGKNFRINGPVDFLLRDGATLSNLTIGDNVTFGGKVYIRMRKNGRIVLGNGVRTGTDVWLVTANDAEITVGENVLINSYNILNGGHGLKIGANCIFGGFVYINTSDHGFRKGELIQKQGFFGAPIEIGDDVWLGGHVFINKGLKIGNGAVIGAGAIVTKDIPEYSIAVGNPAEVIRERV
jgi:acetyltransferase-like isoleucine patch superfamily enzyme